MILYSTLFTNLPVLFYGLFDRDGNETLLESLPQIYGSEGIGQSFYTSRIFLTYFADALWHSVVCFFVPLLVGHRLSLRILNES